MSSSDNGSGHDPVRIGLIGAGAIMRLGHAPTLSAHPDAELIAVFDVNEENARSLADTFSIPYTYTDLHELLVNDDIDAVVVAIPNSQHHEAIEAAAQAGKHVFCEKPLAIDVQTAQRAVEACRQAGVVLQIGFNQRFWSQVQIAKRALDAGVIGRVHGFRSVYSERWDVYPAATRYRYDLHQSGGATIIDLTVHRIDLARYLIGDIAAVFGELSHNELPMAVDDNVWLLTRFENGARGCLSSDRFSPAIVDGTDIYGSEGTIHIASETINPFHAKPLAIYTEKRVEQLPQEIAQAYYPDAWWKEFEGGWISVTPPRRSPHAAQIEGFCRSIREQLQSAPDGMDGLRAQEVVQAAYLSMRRGQWVELPLSNEAPLLIPEYEPSTAQAI